MGTVLRTIFHKLDATVHPDHVKRGGLSLLRSRMLSLCCLLTITACLSLLVNFMLAERELNLINIYFVMGTATLFMGLNRCLTRVTWLSAGLLVILSILMSVGIIHQARSNYAAGFLWFQVLIMPAFFLCGWRLGILISSVTLLVALTTVFLCLSYGEDLPLGGRVVAFRSLAMTLVIVNSLTMGMVALYFFLLRESERTNLEQRDWLQRTARMQEMLQMAGHFALKTNGPLDVLGTALSNLEEPLTEGTDRRNLLSMLAPVESGIQGLASVSKSFSLFSRRYLEEGLEQTSYNVVLQHVDTIYNVGAVLRRARLRWERAQPDVLIYTQTARLVMLLISVLRRIGAEGGSNLSMTARLEKKGLCLDLRYRWTSQDKAELADAPVVFDPELNDDLIDELCKELGVERLVQKDASQGSFHLILVQERSQARLA